MNFKKKIDVLMKSIRDSVNYPVEQEAEFQKALVDGFLRIVQAEQLEQDAELVLYPRRCPDCGEIIPKAGVCDCKRSHYPVVVLQEGYGFWANGGFDSAQKRGYFQIAVSPEGEVLKESARMQELNGRHVLNIVYPGCYILSAICPMPPEIFVRAYRIVTINRSLAQMSCELVQEQEMSDSLWNRLEPAKNLAREECVNPRCRTNHYNWTVQHE